MTILNLTQASQQLGFRTSVTLRKMLRRGVLSNYVREGPDGRATYLEMTPCGLPPLREQILNHLQLHANSPLWHRDHPLDDWTTRANEYLDYSRWSSPPWTREQWVTLRNVIELAEDAD